MTEEPMQTLATEDELLINEQIMGGCNHPDFTVEVERRWGNVYEYATCTHCAKQAHIYRGTADTPDPLKELKLTIPRHCRDMIAIKKVFRHLEAIGWRWTVQRRNGSHQFSLENGPRRIEGPSAVDERAAAREALVLLAKSPFA